MLASDNADLNISGNEVQTYDYDNQEVDSNIIAYQASKVILDTSDEVIIYDENSYFTADLYYENGTPIADREVTFTINSINYTKITDEFGVAKIKINLNPGTYLVRTTYGSIINENTIFVRSSDTTFVKENATNSEIQSIIDNAEENEVIEFLGKNYGNISLTISKNVKLVSNVGTVLNGIANKPVISISGNSASNTKISGFNLKGGSVGIEITNYANNVEISNNTISDSDTGISISNVLSAAIKNNKILNIKNNAIELKSANNINISNNMIKSNKNGIYYDSGNKNINIFNNTLENSRNYAINLDKSGEYSNIENNTITNNENGININCNAEELTISYNAIISNKEDGIHFSSEYRKTASGKDAAIYDNSIIYNGHMNMIAKDTIYYDVNIGSNWFGSSNVAYAFVCNKIKTQFYELNTKQTGPGTFEILIGSDGTANSLIPEFYLSVSFDGGKTYQIVTVKNGKAIVHVSNDDGSVMIRSEGPNRNFELSDYSPYVPEDDEPSDNPSQNIPNSGSKPSSSQTSANGTSNNENQENGISSDSSISGSANEDLGLNIGSSTLESSSSSSQPSSSESSSTYESSSAQGSGDSSNSVAKSTITKSLTIDDENVRIAGIGAIILLIILVVGIYYRNDIKDMISKMKEE